MDVFNPPPAHEEPPPKSSNKPPPLECADLLLKPQPYGLPNLP
jgi:hypothetical protein